MCVLSCKTVCCNSDESTKTDKQINSLKCKIFHQFRQTDDNEMIGSDDI